MYICLANAQVCLALALGMCINMLLQFKLFQIMFVIVEISYLARVLLN